VIGVLAVIGVLVLILLRRYCRFLSHRTRLTIEPSRAVLSCSPEPYQSAAAAQATKPTMARAVRGIYSERGPLR